jgi:hypothetical protein
MVSNLYTDGLKKEVLKDLSQEIQTAILQLSKAFPDQEIEPFNWDQNYIFIPIEIEINLPTMGTVDNIDIRESEQVCLIVHRINYPYQVPYVWSNRRDFPRNKLPHLNPRSPSSPASFCLHRGRLDDWWTEPLIMDKELSNGI